MTLKNLSIGYSTSSAPLQKDINLKLKRGELTCLLGPNGAGKSTLLRTLSGFLTPLGGDILIDGKSLKNYSRGELSRLVGIVLTQRPSVNAMTVENLVGLGRSPYSGFWGRLTGSDMKIINNALEITGTSKLRHRLVDSLSDGEIQKVMIAKALAQDTPIILLDEPTAFLDFPSKVEMIRLLASMAHDFNKAILQSTHDLNMALAMADSVWLLDRNLGVASGSPRLLAESGALENYFSAPGISFNPSNISFELK